jgi:hypothetical protein
VPREGTFRYQVRVPGGNAAETVALLSDFSRHTELHPLIVRVEQATAPDGVQRRYRITDRLAFGPVTFPITYVADVLTADADRVVTVARQSPATTVRNDTRLSTADGVLVADVAITLRAPTLLFGYAFRQAQTAHAALAEKLRAALTR